MYIHDVESARIPKIERNEYCMLDLDILCCPLESLIDDRDVYRSGLDDCLHEETEVSMELLQSPRERVVEESETTL